MSLWARLLYRLGFRQDPGSRFYEVDANLHAALEDLAIREQRPAQEIATELFAYSLNRLLSQEDVLARWHSLSPREQDTTALACLGYTNGEIAFRMGISTETVKTHLHNALVKFNLHSRSELRMLLSELDFSAWDG